ncbi:hypothetical protein [Pseudactinotalea sp.]|uniref:hypothetical protein n=1 Tax=Pseudactinotalea sp. TaxID=1926260 RepID=UPI003B3BD02C
MSQSPERLALTFTPPLVALLRSAEQAAGRTLTEVEVLGIRDAATCIALDPSVAEAMTAARGYQDIDPENCWAEWQQVRDGRD